MPHLVRHINLNCLILTINIWSIFIWTNISFFFELKPIQNFFETSRKRSFLLLFLSVSFFFFLNAFSLFLILFICGAKWPKHLVQNDPSDKIKMWITRLKNRSYPQVIHIKNRNKKVIHILSTVYPHFQKVINKVIHITTIWQKSINC